MSPSFLFLILLAASATAPAPPPRGPATAPESVRIERYVYAAEPEHADSALREIHRVEITTGVRGMDYRFEIDRGEKRERGFVRTTGDGAFVSAVRRVLGADAAPLEIDSLRLDGSRLRIERTRGGKRDSKSIDLPDDRPLAVDASLLLWLRSFPLGGSVEREVFMADWSQRKVNVTVRDRGLEKVTVPAGTFACHRMEVVVKVLMFRPKITFWISAEEPHFLVRHKGKRGPFTAVFLTELVEVVKP